jgi:hypothetical protein
VKRRIIKVRPGLSGIGSVMFRDEDSILSECGRDEHEFYAEDIAPYKGELEIWYVQNHCVVLDLLLILLTVWVVLFPKSGLHLRLLPNLPRPGSPVLARCMALPVPAACPAVGPLRASAVGGVAREK